MNEFYDRLDELYSQGDLAAIEKYLLEAVSQTNDQSPERAALLNELAGFYRGISRYTASEDAFIKSLNIFESANMEATPEYATVLLNLAGLYRLMGDSEKAIDLFKNAMSKLEASGATDSYAYVSILNNIALAYQEKGEPQQALQYASKALELMRTFASGDHEIATSLNNLASIRLGLGELDTADTLVTEALEYYDAMPEPNVHHAAAITTKAAIMSRRGDYKSALAGFRKALDLTQRFFGENIEFAICKRNISEICELLGDNATAAQELTDAIHTMERLLPPDHPAIKSARDKLTKILE